MKRRDFVKMIGGAAASPLIFTEAARGNALSESDIALVTPNDISQRSYDVVIVGAGVAGAIVAKQLSDQGKSVLIIEAGTNEGLTNEGFQGYVEKFYSSVAKHSNSPYPSNPNALSPTDGINGYFEEKGPLPISGSYTRVAGGATMHWEGKTLRMLPEDFELRAKYGQGLNWPIGYEVLEPYYRKAEQELLVAGDVKEQAELGILFPKEYKFPLEKLPPSFLDEQVRKKVNGKTIELDGSIIELKLSTFPQAKAGCQGNASCVPICPIQVKYDARRTLRSISNRDRVHLIAQAVASKVDIDTTTGRITSIQYKHYTDKNSPDHVVGVARGRLFVLAANAVENARLMLASGLPSTSGLMGCNLMDHPFILAWALMPEVVGAMRGPLVTSGIGSFRKGVFRKNQAAFSIDIHNDGWGWAGIGTTDVARDAIDNKRKYGPELRQELISRISRQILLAFMCEMPAVTSNRVAIDSRYKDQLGNYRPVIHFDIPEYSKAAMAYARDVSRSIFRLLGAEDHTKYSKSDPAYFEHKGEGYWFRGGNHFSGTHIIDRKSVV